MNRATVRSLAATVTLGVFLVTGCGDSGPKREGPPTYPVSGVVTHGGAAVQGATVRFERADGSGASTGRTDAQGKYVLATFEPGDGAPAGDYRVTIVKMEGGGGAEAVLEEDPNYTGAEEAEEVEVKNVLPEQYANAETSGLTATVTEGTNTFDFALE